MIRPRRPRAKGIGKHARLGGGTSAGAGKLQRATRCKEKQYIVRAALLPKPANGTISGTAVPTGAHLQLFIHAGAHLVRPRESESERAPEP